MHTGQISIFLLEKTKQSTQDTPDPLGDVNYPDLTQVCGFMLLKHSCGFGSGIQVKNFLSQA